jgi:hypothetical protein
MLEKAVVSVIGTESQVYAEFCDEESLLDGQIQDRRMFTYYRKEDGSLTHLLFGELVPYVFIRVDRVFGFISLDELAARIAHAISRASDTSIYK